MGIFDSSKSSTSNQTTNYSENRNVQDTEGVVVAGAGGDVTVISTDYNAFDNAAALARQAVDFASGVASDAQSLSLNQTRAIIDAQKNAISANTDVTRSALVEVGAANKNALGLVDQLYGSALDFGSDIVSGSLSSLTRGQSDALGAVADANSGALGAIKSFASQAQTGVEDAFDRALTFAKGLVATSQDSLGGTVTALNTIAREQSKSTDERVSEVSQSAIKYMAIAVGALALAAVAYGAFKK